MFYSLTVPTPNVVLTVHNDSTYYAGKNLSITCVVTISVKINVDSAVIINVNWYNGTRHITNDTGSVSITSLTGKGPSYNSTLIIGPLSDFDNRSNFTCRAYALSDSRTVFVGQSEVGESSVSILVQQRSQL